VTTLTKAFLYLIRIKKEVNENLPHFIGEDFFIFDYKLKEG
jgi:hypothetical protein